MEAGKSGFTDETPAQLGIAIQPSLGTILDPQKTKSIEIKTKKPDELIIWLDTLRGNLGPCKAFGRFRCGVQTYLLLVINASLK